MEINFDNFKENEDSILLEEISEWEAKSISMQLAYEIDNDLYLENAIEEWRSLNDYLGDILNSDIQVSNLGNLRNNTKGTIIKGNLQKKSGYIHDDLWLRSGNSKTFKRHRLVLIAFAYRDDYNSMYVNHKNSIKHQNWLSNLEWITPRHNTRHAMDTGLLSKEKRHIQYDFLDEAKAHKICKQLEIGFNSKDIATSLGVSQRQVDHIRCKDTWKDISAQYNITRKLAPRLENWEIDIICNHFINTNNKPNYIKLAKEVFMEYNSKFVRRMEAIRYRENLSERTKDYIWENK